MGQTLRLLSLTGILLLTGCRQAPQLTVINRSSVELTHVVISGQGFSTAIGVLPAAAQRQLTVTPKGESGIQLSFEANGKPIVSQESGYFENNAAYHVTAIVAPDFSVTVDSKL